MLLGCLIRRLVDGPAVDHRPQHLRLKNLGGRDAGQVAVENDKVRHISRNQLTFEGFREFGVGRALGVGKENLA